MRHEHAVFIDIATLATLLHVLCSGNTLTQYRLLWSVQVVDGGVGALGEGDGM